ncbi:S8 family serine peptidase [Saccharopolyspora sp. WRP15-2]|uniref:S8 family serine peptidase n=1 Tax=Saccharopolyspora oryzae TaxID=2997343 RepID=A0ABT4UU21_9PSEU|nr:S8 family serine peptidase [Saccharopolyspora oryzae]MDA3625225.1 S8 family serine peptidase [Saccharopolyspora oryzae]
MTNTSGDPAENKLDATPDELLEANRERGDGSFETGRMIATFRAGAFDEGVHSLRAAGLRVVDARDFAGQVVAAAELEQADALALPLVGAAIVTGTAAAASGISAQSDYAQESPIAVSQPERFASVTQAAADGTFSEYLRGFVQAAETIARGFRGTSPQVDEAQVQVLGATWGLLTCQVPQSAQTGGGISVAVLDTGLDLAHPDFAGRQVTSETFVGQPVQDLYSHGTHCTGTACGPVDPPDSTPRYGIGDQASIFPGKVLSNSGTGATGSILAGINWAIANGCEVISMSLGGRSSVQAAYSAAGEAALNSGLLIVAAAGNDGAQTGAPANSPSIMSVASLDQDTLTPSSFSNFGKIDIAAPGRDVFSSVPMPARYATMSGTSMATPHVAGCASLWAQTSPNLRGMDLWRKLVSTAKSLPQPASRVGAGLVQAP